MISYANWTDFGSYYDMKVHYSMVSTTTSEIKGTAPYMAPEICPPCPVSRGATEEADIYAFAVTTYEILMPGISYPWCKELSSASLRHPTTIYLAVKNGKRPSLEDLAGFYSRKDHASNPKRSGKVD